MGEFQRISVTQAKQLMAEKSPLIVDVRDADSFKQAAISGSQHLSYDSFPGLRKKADKQHPVLVYCYHGNASQEMAQMFVDFGFAEVYSMDGGFEAWRLQS